MRDDQWDIQNAFEAGADHDQHATGESLSVSEAILDELSWFGVFTESELASRLHLDKAVVLEQLYELRSQGRVDGTEGAWTRDFEHGELPEPDDEYIF